MGEEEDEERKRQKESIQAKAFPTQSTIPQGDPPTVTMGTITLRVEIDRRKLLEGISDADDT